MRNRSYIYIFILFLCLGYLGFKGTYASYESEVSGKINPKIANWNISINGLDATVNEENVELNIDEVLWTCNGQIREGKVGPGCTGTITLEVDATGTEVAALYEFDIVDKNIDPNKILKITSMEFNNSNFYRVDVSKYSGYLSLDDIKNNPKLTITIDVIWEDLEDIVYDEEFFSNDDNYITIDFFAKQYLGETLVPYTE